MSNPNRKNYCAPIDVFEDTVEGDLIFELRMTKVPERLAKRACGHMLVEAYWGITGALLRWAIETKANPDVEYGIEMVKVVNKSENGFDDHILMRWNSAECQFTIENDNVA